MNKTAIVAVLFMAVIAACSDRHDSFSSFANVDRSGWAYGDTLFFAPEEIVDGAQWDIAVDIRHDNSFPFRNVWLEVCRVDADTTVTDTVNIELADIYGHWQGKGLGPSFQIERYTASSVALPENCRIGVRHIMRVDTLRGIEQVGVTIRRTETANQ